jgi:shikimate kinase
MHLFLVGHRGVGKTTLGSLWAQRHGWDHWDSDGMLAEQAGVDSVRTLAQQLGRERFRDREAEWLRQQVEAPQSCCRLISLGGGIVEHDGAWQLLQRLSCIILWLPEPEMRLRSQQKGLPQWGVGSTGHAEDFASLWQCRERRLRELSGCHCMLEGCLEEDLQRLSKSIFIASGGR